jgi:hypothetical protein
LTLQWAVEARDADASGASACVATLLPIEELLQRRREELRWRQPCLPDPASLSLPNPAPSPSRRGGEITLRVHASRGIRPQRHLWRTGSYNSVDLVDSTPIRLWRTGCPRSLARHGYFCK